MAEKGEITCKDAGRRGGEKTSERHGPEFYERIGRMGGQRTGQLVKRGREVEGKEECPKSES